MAFSLALVLALAFALPAAARGLALPGKPRAGELSSGDLVKARGQLQLLNYYIMKGSGKATPRLTKTGIDSYKCWYQATKKKVKARSKAKAQAKRCKVIFEKSITALGKKYDRKPVVSVEFYDDGHNPKTAARKGSNSQDIKALLLEEINHSSATGKEASVSYTNKQLIEQYRYLPGEKIVYARFFGTTKEASSRVGSTVLSDIDNSISKDSSAASASARSRASRSSAAGGSAASNRLTASGSSTKSKNYSSDNANLRYDYYVIYFDLNSAKLTISARAVLDKAIKVARSRPDVKMTVVGHTDTSGARSYNSLLSEKRAKAVAQYVRARQYGIDPDRVLGRGESEQAVRTPDNTREKRNRRTEIFLRK